MSCAGVINPGDKKAVKGQVCSLHCTSPQHPLLLTSLFSHRSLCHQFHPFTLPLSLFKSAHSHPCGPVLNLSTFILTPPPSLSSLPPSLASHQSRVISMADLLDCDDRLSVYHFTASKHQSAETDALPSPSLLSNLSTHPISTSYSIILALWPSAEVSQF